MRKIDLLKEEKVDSDNEECTFKPKLHSKKRQSSVGCEDTSICTTNCYVAAVDKFVSRMSLARTIKDEIA